MVTAPRRGDVWWLEDPEIGRRPAVVLTRNAAIEILTWLLVAPVTRRVRDIPTEVSLDADDGMPERCAVTLDNVRPVRTGMLSEHITSLSAARMHEVCRALGHAVDC